MVPSELGATLQQHREEKGLSLEEIEERTHIRRKYLEALEAGDWDALPPGVYTRGLLKSYARAVGLSTNSVLRMYVKERPQEARLPEPQLISQPLVEEPRYSPEILLSVVLFAVAAVLLVLLYQSQIRPILTRSMNALANGPTAVTEDPAATQVPPTEPPSVSIVAPTEAPTETPTEAAVAGTPEAGSPTALASGTPVAAASQAPAAATATAPATAVAGRTPSSRGTASPSPAPTALASALSLDVLATGKVWLRVIADGEEIYTGFMQEGDRQSWGARESFNVRTGNAGGTQVTVNGQRVPSLGADGAVVTCQWRLLPDGAIEQSC